jgi:hypothetical protein
LQPSRTSRSLFASPQPGCTGVMQPSFSFRRNPPLQIIIISAKRSRQSNASELHYFFNLHRFSRLTCSASIASRIFMYNDSTRRVKQFRTTMWLQLSNSVCQPYKQRGLSTGKDRAQPSHFWAFANKRILKYDCWRVVQRQNNSSIQS